MSGPLNLPSAFRIRLAGMHSEGECSLAGQRTLAEHASSVGETRLQMELRLESRELTASQDTAVHCLALQLALHIASW